MERYTQDNTEGYTDEQLEELNGRLNFVIRRNGWTSDHADEIQWASERVLADFDTEISNS